MLAAKHWLTFSVIWALIQFSIRQPMGDAGEDHCSGMLGWRVGPRVA
jgi:hypothetical protein